MSFEVQSNIINLEAISGGTLSLENLINSWKGVSSKLYRSLSWDAIQSDVCFQGGDANSEYFKKLADGLFSTFRNFDLETRKLTSKSQIVDRFQTFSQLFTNHVQSLRANVYLRYLKMFFHKYFSSLNAVTPKPAVDETKLAKINYLENLSNQYLFLISTFYRDNPYFKSFVKTVLDVRKSLQIKESQIIREFNYLNFEQVVELRYRLARLILTDFDAVISKEQKIKLQSTVQSFNW